MERRAAILAPKKVRVNGVDQWRVWVPSSLRKQEGAKDGRKYFPKEVLAKEYCAKLAADLRNHTDLARGLTIEQKIEATAGFARLAEVPGASMTAAIDHYLAHLAQMERSGWSSPDKVDTASAVS